MNRKTFRKRESKNWGSVLTCGIVLTLVVMMISISVMAALMESTKINESAVGYYVVFIHLISILSGVRTVLRKQNEHKLYTSLFLGLLYWVMLLAMTALFFGCQYQGISVTIAVVMTGCVIAVIMENCRINVRKSGTSRKRRC